MIKVEGLEINRSYFPNGESHIDISKLKELIRDAQEQCRIVVKYENDSDIFGLIGVVETIRDYCKEYDKEMDLILDIPYLPYSRMDRGNDKKLESLKVLANIINSLKFKEVWTNEVHSEVSNRLIKNLNVRNTTKEIFELYTGHGGLSLEERGTYIVYPDKGASDRYRSQIDTDRVIEIEKKREFETGRLIGMEIVNPKYDYRDCKEAIIVDDICSKGGTFGWCADLLLAQGITNIVLIVTHLEETILEGEMYKNKYIKKIIALDTMLDSEAVGRVMAESRGKIVVMNGNSVDMR